MQCFGWGDPADPSEIKFPMFDANAESNFLVDAPQRVGPLAALPLLLDELGVSFETASADMRFDNQALSDPDRRIPFEAAGELLRRCAELSDCPHLGLLLGMRSDLDVLGSSGEWMRNAPDLEAALSGFIRFQHANSRGASLYLRRHGDAALLGYGIYDRRAVAADQIYALVVAMMFNAVRELSGGRVQPVEILFAFRRPREIEPYTSLFGSRIHFDQPESGIVLTPAALATPVEGARPDALEALERAARASAPPSERPWTDRVRHMVRPFLLRGEPTSVQAAAHLGVHVRTLARRLAQEGASFQQVLDEVRYAMATELLKGTDLRVGDVAAALSYSGREPFNYAFRKWTGLSPSAWRKQAGSI